MFFSIGNPKNSDEYNCKKVGIHYDNPIIL